MTNVDQNEASARKAVHKFIDASGAEVEKQEAATGISYQDRASGRVFTFQIPGAVAGTVQTMLSVFGAKTLATNTASQARQQGLADEVALIEERFGEDLKDGQWNSPADRTGGPRIDLEAAIEAIEEIVKADGMDFSRVRDRAMAESLDDYDSKPGEAFGVAYLRAALKNPRVSAAYAKLRGKAAPETNDLV